MTDERETPGVSLIRDPGPDPEAVGEDQELVDRLHAEIAATGPITFARFMERALYEPDHGYYRRPAAGPGFGGDFVTAPELHPIFGAAMARLLEQAWEAIDRPDPFTVTEAGAGSGALAAGLLTGLRDAGSPMLAAIRYRPVEREAARLSDLERRLAEDGLAGHLVDGAAPEECVEVGAVIANEVLDALPVHRVIGRPDGIRELFVGVDDERFAWREGAPTTPDLAARLGAEGIALADGQVTEVCLAIDGWLAGATAHLERGPVVLVDYGDEPAALHSTARPDGTLRAFARHAVGGDALRHVGRQDITATVDLAAVRAAASHAGLDPVGETTQAELLAAAGDLASASMRRPGATIEDALLLRSALMRLLDPRGMGGFRVLVFGRGLPSDATLPALRRLAR
jgi:SAM-dependent MidA family methyltransferase